VPVGLLSGREGENTMAWVDQYGNVIMTDAGCGGQVSVSDSPIYGRQVRVVGTRPIPVKRVWWPEICALLSILGIGGILTAVIGLLVCRAYRNNPIRYTGRLGRTACIVIIILYVLAFAGVIALGGIGLDTAGTTAAI